MKKIMIASDIHGSAYYCRQLLERYKEEKAERLILLGDILYHGPRNDLPKEYAPKEVIAMLNPLRNESFVSVVTVIRKLIRWYSILMYYVSRHLSM